MEIKKFPRVHQAEWPELQLRCARLGLAWLGLPEFVSGTIGTPPLPFAKHENAMHGSRGAVAGLLVAFAHGNRAMTETAKDESHEVGQRTPIENCFCHARLFPNLGNHSGGDCSRLVTGCSAGNMESSVSAVNSKPRINFMAKRVWQLAI